MFFAEVCVFASGWVGVGQRELHPDQTDTRGYKSLFNTHTHSENTCRYMCLIIIFAVCVCVLQVAELFEDLKSRVSQFNMHISETSSPSDYTSVHTQKFILQVTHGHTHTHKFIPQMLIIILLFRWRLQAHFIQTTSSWEQWTRSWPPRTSLEMTPGPLYWYLIPFYLPRGGKMMMMMMISLSLLGA